MSPEPSNLTIRRSKTRAWRASIYHNSSEMIVEKMNPGGIIITDNVLWSGKVVEKVKEDDTSTIALQCYNKMVVEDNRLETVMLPIRDGLSISRIKES